MSLLLEKLSADESIEKELVEVCPLCGSRDASLMFWNFDRRYHLPGKFGTHKCGECGLIRLSPRPTIKSIAQFYPADYGAYSVPPINEVSERNRLRNALRQSALYSLGYHKSIGLGLKAISPLISRFFLDRATYLYGDLFPRFVPNGSALEIGCGNGIFLECLKRHGWRVQGIDLSPIAAARTKELFGIDVFVGEVEEAPFPAETFDYIHLSHVVEHFYDPLKSMQKIFDLLKPGGVVFVEVPNADGVGAELSNEYWYGWDAPRHLFTFTPETLSLMMKRAGFELSKMYTKLWDFFDWAATYEHEAKSGEELPNRPIVLERYREATDRQRVKAKSLFESDPSRGDFILFWGRKPDESKSSAPIRVRTMQTID